MFGRELGPLQGGRRVEAEEAVHLGAQVAQSQPRVAGGTLAHEAGNHVFEAGIGIVQFLERNKRAQQYGEVQVCAVWRESEAHRTRRHRHARNRRHLERLERFVRGPRRTRPPCRPFRSSQTPSCRRR